MSEACFNDHARDGHLRMFVKPKLLSMESGAEAEQ